MCEKYAVIKLDMGSLEQKILYCSFSRSNALVFMNEQAESEIQEDPHWYKKETTTSGDIITIYLLHYFIKKTPICKYSILKFEDTFYGEEEL